MVGEECITKMMDMADFEIKKTSKKQKQKMRGSVKGANISRIRRKPIRPKNAGFISPFDCLYSVAKKYDSYASENIHYMCISFILRSVEETAIKANSVVNVLTNHIFIKRKKRKMIILKKKRAEMILKTISHIISSVKSRYRCADWFWIRGKPCFKI